MAERDYFYLCGECGVSTAYDEWEHVFYDDEGEERPRREGDTDPDERCPNCKFLHRDNDSGPGIWDGTRREMELQRFELLMDPVWSEAWGEEKRMGKTEDLVANEVDGIFTAPVSGKVRAEFRGTEYVGTSVQRVRVQLYAAAYAVVLLEEADRG